MSEINVEELRKYGGAGRVVVVTSDSWTVILDEIEALRSQVARVRAVVDQTAEEEREMNRRLGILTTGRLDSKVMIEEVLAALDGSPAPVGEKPRLVYCAQCGAEPKDPCIEWGEPVGRVGYFHSARLQHLRDLEAELR